MVGQFERLYSWTARIAEMTTLLEQALDGCRTAARRG